MYSSFNAAVKGRHIHTAMKHHITITANTIQAMIGCSCDHNGEVVWTAVGYLCVDTLVTGTANFLETLYKLMLRSDMQHTDKGVSIDELTNLLLMVN